MDLYLSNSFNCSLQQLNNTKRDEQLANSSYNQNLSTINNSKVYQKPKNQISKYTYNMLQEYLNICFTIYPTYYITSKKESNDTNKINIFRKKSNQALNCSCPNIDQRQPKQKKSGKAIRGDERVKSTLGNQNNITQEIPIESKVVFVDSSDFESSKSDYTLIKKMKTEIARQRLKLNESKDEGYLTGKKSDISNLQKIVNSDNDLSNAPLSIDNTNANINSNLLNNNDIIISHNENLALQNENNKFVIIKDNHPKTGNLAKSKEKDIKMTNTNNNKNTNKTSFVINSNKDEFSLDESKQLSNFKEAKSQIISHNMNNTTVNIHTKPCSCTCVIF